MPPYSRNLMRIVLCSAVIIVCALFVAFAPVGKSSLAQGFLDDFNVITQTTVTVTVTLADGQTVAVPVDLHYTFEHRNGLGYTYLDANAQQPLNAVATVQESSYISAAIEALVYRANPTPVVLVPPTPTAMPAVVVVPPTVAPEPTVAAPAPTAQLDPTATSAPATTQNPGIGADVFTGDIKWRVISAEELGNKLVSDNQFIEDATTGGRFVRLIIEVDNRGSEPFSYWEPEMQDAQGRTFSEYSEALYFIPDDQDCVLLTVNPGLSKKCTHIYEVAGDAQGLKVKVTDNIFLGNEAIIELR